MHSDRCLVNGEKDFCVHRWVFDRSVGEHDGRRRFQLGRVGGGVGHEVLIGVAIHIVEIAAIRTAVLRIAQVVRRPEMQRMRSSRARLMISYLSPVLR